MKFRVFEENNNYTIKDKNSEPIIDGLTEEEIKAFRKIYRAIRIAQIKNK